MSYDPRKRRVEDLADLLDAQSWQVHCEIRWIMPGGEQAPPWPEWSEKLIARLARINAATFRLVRDLRRGLGPSKSAGDSIYGGLSSEKENESGTDATSASEKTEEVKEKPPE